jgi:hypothetical protein
VRFLNEDFGPAFKDVKDFISENFGPVFEDLKSIIGDLLPIIKPVADVLLDVFVFNAKLGWEAIKLLVGVLEKVVDVAADIAGIAGDIFGGLIDGAKDAAGAIGDLFDGVEDDLKNAAGSVDVFNSAISGMGNAVSVAVGKATGGFKKYEKQVAATMSDVGRSAALALGMVIPTFRKIGARMANAVADGIKTAGKAAIDAARLVGGQAGDAARGQSPKWAQAGNTLGKTLAQGITASKGSSTSAGGAIAQAAAAAARATAQAFFAAGKAMGDSLAAGIRSAIAGVAAAADAMAAAASRANNHRASGGAVSAGHSYIVGEQGQELFVPKTNGYIIPNHALPTFGGIAGSAAGRSEFVITNWQTGQGYFTSIADGAVDTARRFDGQRSRMRT